MYTQRPYLEVCELSDDYGYKMNIRADEKLRIGDKFPLNTGPTILGRRSDRSDILLLDRRISGLHAEIVYEHHQFRIAALKDNNPVSLNGKTIEYQVRHLLVHGDRIGLGLPSHVVFIFCDPAPDGDEHTEVYLVGLRIGSTVNDVWVNDQQLDPPLDIYEFKLLQLLDQNEGGVVLREDILDYVWGKDQYPSENQLDKLVLQVRKRLRDLDDYPYIVTVRGRGYKLEQPPLA